MLICYSSNGNLIQPLKEVHTPCVTVLRTRLVFIFIIMVYVSTILQSNLTVTVAQGGWPSCVLKAYTLHFKAFLSRVRARLCGSRQRRAVRGYWRAESAWIWMDERGVSLLPALRMVRGNRSAIAALILSVFKCMAKRQLSNKRPGLGNGSHLCLWRAVNNYDKGQGNAREGSAKNRVLITF